MTIELNRRTFIVLLGAATATAAAARPARQTARPTVAFTGTPRCFMTDQHLRLPAHPKTSAITYLHP